MERIEGMSGPEDKNNKSPYVTTGTSLSVVVHGDGIPMAVDGRRLEDNKSKTFRYVTDTSASAIPHGDLLIIAGDLRSLKDIKSRTLSHYVTGMPAMGHGGVIPMDDDSQGLEDGALSPYEDGIPMARCKDGIPMAGDTQGLEDNKSSNEDDGTTLVSLTYEGRVLMEADARVSVQVPSMESLPSDVVQDIVSRVPAETVLECKFVCLRWRTIINASNFANMHLKHQIKLIHGADDESDDNLAAKVESCLFFACRVDDPDVIRTLLFLGGKPSGENYIYSQNLKRVYHPPMHHERLYNHLVGSCNGLVCAFQRHSKISDPMYICNPLTREYVYLPKLVVKNKDDVYDGTACGFGYVRSTNEFKVVRVHYPKPKNGRHEGNVEVYTLGSGYGWRAIGTVSYQLGTAGTYANDAIYWITGKEVVAFYLADEKFGLLSAPPGMQNLQSKDRYGLVALGRHLCLYMAKLRMEIWSLMKKSSDSKGTWYKEFDIDFSKVEFDMDYDPIVSTRESQFRPILLTKNGEILFIYDSSVLFCYDTKTTELRMISDEASVDYFEHVEAIAHVNTLASLKAMGENSKTYTVRVPTPWDDVIDDLGRVAIGGDEVDTTPFSLNSSAL